MKYKMILLSCIVGAALLRAFNMWNYSDVRECAAGDSVEIPLIVSNADATLAHSFRITNPSRGPLTILGHHASCTCTSANFSRSTIPSRESAELDVTARFNRPGKPIKQVVSVAVNTSVPQMAELQYVLRAHLYPRFAVQHDSITIGSVPPGQECEAFFYLNAFAYPEEQFVTACGTLDSLLQSASDECELKSIGSPEFEVLDCGMKKTTWRVVLALRSGCVSGDQTRAIKLNVPGMPPGIVGLQLSWKVEHDIAANPNRFFVGDLKQPAAQGPWSCRVASATGRPFVISGIRVSESFVKCSIKEKQDVISPGDRYDLVITVDTAEVMGTRFWTTVQIDVDGEERAVIPVIVSGFMGK